MIADLLPANSSVVGVDASKTRVSLCKNVIQKYHINKTTSGIKKSPENEAGSKAQSNVNIRLYYGDGTTFRSVKSTRSELIFDSTSALEEQLTCGKRKRMNKSAKAREKRRLLELSSQEIVSPDIFPDDKTQKSHVESNENAAHQESAVSSMQTFDRVLVDAECSSDGAIRHIQKRQSAPTTKSAAWTDSNMDELIDLQKRLIESGFRLLKSGGILLYSTCSLSQRQNEEVVNWLLDKHSDAYIIPVSFGDSSKLDFIQEGAIIGTVRFNPFVSVDESKCGVDSMLVGGGFFLAKLGKR